MVCVNCSKYLMRYTLCLREIYHVLQLSELTVLEQESIYNRELKSLNWLIIVVVIIIVTIAAAHTYTHLSLSQVLRVAQRVDPFKLHLGKQTGNCTESKLELITEIWGVLFFLKKLFWKTFYLLIFGCPGSRCCTRAFSSCGEQGLLSSCSAQVSHCGDFSCCFRVRALEFGLQELWHMGLVALRHVGSSPTRDRTHVFHIGRFIFLLDH